MKYIKNLSKTISLCNEKIKSISLYDGFRLIAVLVIGAEIGALNYWDNLQDNARINTIRAQQTELNDQAMAHQTDLKEQARAETQSAAYMALRPPLKSYKSLAHSCYANGQDMTCHITNLSNDPVAVCVQGLVSQKKSAGVRLYSIPVCSGPIGPRSTHEIVGSWKDGSPRDICKGAYGMLDWDNCNFEVIDVKGE